MIALQAVTSNSVMVVVNTTAKLFRRYLAKIRDKSINRVMCIKEAMK